MKKVRRKYDIREITQIAEHLESKCLQGFQGVFVL